MNTSAERERQRFEAWMRRYWMVPPSLQRDATGEYVDLTTASHFDAFREGARKTVTRVAQGRRG